MKLNLINMHVVTSNSRKTRDQIFCKRGVDKICTSRSGLLHAHISTVEYLCSIRMQMATMVTVYIKMIRNKSTHNLI